MRWLRLLKSGGGVVAVALAAFAMWRKLKEAQAAAHRADRERRRAVELAQVARELGLAREAEQLAALSKAALERAQAAQTRREAVEAEHAAMRMDLNQARTAEDFAAAIARRGL